MVLTALEKTYAIPPKDITPFQHWFNKNSINLKDEYDIENKDKFMKWCEEKYNEK